MTVQSGEIKSDFAPQNCSEFLMLKHLEENGLMRYRCGLTQNERAKPSHPVGRDTDLTRGGGDTYGRGFKVGKPLDTEIIWELYYLKHIWKTSLNFNNAEVVWDAAGLEYSHQWLGTGITDGYTIRSWHWGGLARSLEDNI